MFFPPTLVLAALPFLFLVAAAPVEERPRDEISIPIAKRSGFRDVDGVVDIAMLQSYMQRTITLVFHFLTKQTLQPFSRTRRFSGRFNAVSRRSRETLAQLTPLRSS